MYDDLISSLRICGRINSANDNCIAFHDESCEAEPVCMYELMVKAADAIEEQQKRVPKSGVWREEESGYDDVYYECSVCGAGICTIDGSPVDNTWSYCPECGAKMTGVERLPEPPKEE